MRKVLSILTALILLVTIVACGKIPDTFAEFIVKEDVETTSISLEIDIVDPDDEIKGDILITLTNKEDDKTQSKTTSKEQLKEDKEEGKLIEFTSLVSNKEYELEIKTTVNEKNITVFKKTYKTRTSSKVDINTTEDFLKIKDRRSASYELKADLDFSDVDQDDINKGIITIFSGEFNGNNHTIKNLTIETSNINMGLFNQLSGSAVVKNLNLDNVTIKQKGNATGSKRAGILFGQNTSRSTVVENITITNSTLDVKLNGTSNYQELGFLGGASVAKISNIVIEDTNKMLVTQERMGDLKIGGLIGKMDNTSADDVVVKDILAKGVIEYQALQKDGSEEEDSKEDALGIKSEKVSLNIAGLVGQANNIKFESIVVKTDILVKESKLVVVELEEKQKRNTKINLDVSGVVSRNANVSLNDVLFNGNIKVEEINVVSLLDEDSKYTYDLNINVATIFAQTSTYSSRLNNVLRLDGLVDVFTSSDSNTLIKTGSLFVVAANVTYNENNKFGVSDESLKDNNSDVLVFSVEDLFNEESFVYKNYLK